MRLFTVLQNLNVSGSALKHKHMEKKLGSIRSQQVTIDALIGKKHYMTNRHLRTHSDWLRKLSQHTLIGWGNYQKIRSTRTGIKKGYRQTYLHRRQHQWLRLFEAGSHKNDFEAALLHYTGSFFAFFTQNKGGQEGHQCSCILDSVTTIHLII